MIHDDGAVTEYPDGTAMNTITESPGLTLGEDIDTETDPDEMFTGNEVVDTNGPSSEAGLNLRNPVRNGSVGDDATLLTYITGP